MTRLSCGRMIRLLAHSLSPPSLPREQVVSLRRPRPSSLLTGKGMGGRGAKSQIIWSRESLSLYKSFFTLWVRLSERKQWTMKRFERKSNFLFRKNSQILKEFAKRNSREQFRNSVIIFRKIVRIQICVKSKYKMLQKMWNFSSYAACYFNNFSKIQNVFLCKF